MKLKKFITLGLIFTLKARACDYNQANATMEKYQKVFMKIKDIAFVAPETGCRAQAACIKIGIVTPSALKAALELFGSNFELDGCAIDFVKSEKFKLLDK